MVAGLHKSRSFRRVSKRTPGAKNVMHYVRRKPSRARCAITGEVLHGVKRMTDAKMRNTPKTQKRAERPFGGVLGSRASRRVIIEESRQE